MFIVHNGPRRSRSKCFTLKISLQLLWCWVPNKVRQSVIAFNHPVARCSIKRTTDHHHTAFLLPRSNGRRPLLPFRVRTKDWKPGPLIKSQTHHPAYHRPELTGARRLCCGSAQPDSLLVGSARTPLCWTGLVSGHLFPASRILSPAAFCLCSAGAHGLVNQARCSVKAAAGHRTLVSRTESRR